MALRARIGEGSRGTILVTGGAGYVGSHIVKALALAGYRPVIYDKFTTGASIIANWGQVERGDMTDRERLRRVVAEYKPLAVIHAATSPGMVATDAPKAAYETIVLGTLNLLEAMREAQISLLCLMTSAAIYGSSSGLVISEQTPVRPLTAYAASLAAIETMASDFSLSADMRFVSLRLFSAAGADPDLQTGWRLQNSRRLFAAAIDAATGHAPHVPIYGSHFATRDGTALRDYIHVTDIADATLRALEGLFSDRAAGPYNIGTGKNYSVFEVIRAVERLAQTKVTMHFEAKRADEPPMLSADIARAAQELLFKPEHSSLDEIAMTEWSYRKTLRQASADAGFSALRPSPHHDDVPARTRTPVADETATDLSGDDIHDDLVRKLDAFLERN